MQNFIFVLKTLFSSGLALGIIGGIVGKIYSVFVPDHAHQIIPTMLVTAVLGFFAGGLTGLALGGYFVVQGNHDWRKALLYAILFGLLELGFVMWWLFRG